jgi:predicted esterase
MKPYKRSITSSLLGRMAHADVFELGSSPSFLFVLFGGSGIDEEEYERRSESVIPVFDRVLETLERGGMNAVMVHVTAPYDVPFNRFAESPSAAELWKAHVLKELLEPWQHLRYFVCGFSGGAALALNGLQMTPRCFGGAAFGADAIPKDFVCPDHWVEKLRLYSAPDDRVSNHPANRRIIETLESRGQVEEYRLRSGGHRLADYAMSCLVELIRFADRLAPPACSSG